MKQLKLIIMGVAVCMAATAYGQKKNDESFLKKARTVATKEGNLIVGNPKLFNDTLEIPLSYLTEELQIVQLDNRDEALVGGGRTSISDNYILVSNSKQIPFKLFDKKGKFITTIGSYGQGPDEYLNVYDHQLDEKNRRIYILPWQSQKILVFDFEGKAQNHIPLPLRVPKGAFRVDAEKNLVTVTTLPFEGMPAVVWTQDMEGNRKSHVPAGHLTLPRTFSNEVDVDHNTSDYVMCLMAIEPTRQDSLYHYNYATNKLEPRFTLDFGKSDITWHAYWELPNHFLGNFQVPVQIDAHTTVGTAPKNYIIDKRTLKGNYFKLYNDFIGKSDYVWPSFSAGYFVQNMEPTSLIEKIEKELKDTKLPKDKRAKLQKILDSLNEEDNNVVIYAKLKK